MGTIALRVLFVDDSDTDAELVRRELARVGFAVSSTRVDHAAAIAKALDERWDVVLCDYSMPGISATQVFEQVRARDPHVPFIIVSGTIGEEAAVAMMKTGASDFVLKDRLGRLGPAVMRELADAAGRRELRRAKDMLARTEQLRLLGQMATGITHDLRNLLNPMVLHLELLSRELARRGSTTPNESISAMRLIVQRGVETIDRLRAFSRQEAEVMTDAVDVASVVEQAIEIARPRLAQTTAVVIDKRFDSTPGSVRGNAGELVNAVVNLLVNAIDACGERGTIVVTARDDGAHAVIDVVDDGPGMPPEVQARAFEPFFSTKGDRGTGFGLANVFATMRRHGGDVRLETSPGKGAKFTLRLPR